MSMKWLGEVCKSIKKEIVGFKEKIVLRYRLRDHYRDLAPIDNIPNGKEYLKALHWAIKNKKIKNIALTGPYGSGKSSVINSYLKQHPIIKAKHLRISMATFIENAVDENGQPKKIAVDSQQIEEGILKQLFYKVSHREIPQSRYRKLHRVSFKFVFLILVLLAVATLFFSFIFLPEQFCEKYNLIISAGAKVKLTEGKTLCIFGGVAFSTVMALAYILCQLYSKIKLSELVIKSATVTPSENDHESIFNKNMDEIVYFFEETKYRVVFFEDLDRLDSSEIFVQLRELNTLLNNSNTIKRPIVFVYAIKDDIFTKEDRTKFFEFIIPVIPVINATNSGEILLDLFKTRGGELFKHNITADYILDVSPYISDMRLLQNIHNEFLLYKRTLQTGQGLELSDEIMLSFIIFKNLFPKDFADLQGETGIVKRAFEDKQNYIEARQRVLQDSIDAATDLIKRVEEDVLKSTREIKVAMLCALTGWKGTAIRIERGYSVQFYVTKILEDSFDLSQLFVEGRRQVYYQSWNGGSDRENVTNLEEICRPYYERCEALKHYEERQMASIQADVERDRTLKTQLSSRSLRSLIETEGDDAIFSDEVRAHKLLVFMLRKGYIDEKYVSYVNYFKGNSITTDDMNYILAVKDHEAKPFEYAISKVAQVVCRLLPHEFEQREALNYCVLEYLLVSIEHDDKLGRMIKCLSDGSEQSWEFVDGFVMGTSNVVRFIQLLSQSWCQIWQYIYQNSVLTDDRKSYYLELLCNNNSIDVLLTLNGDGKFIAKFFEEHDDILQRLSAIEPERMISIISAMGISFSALKIEGVNSQVLNYIFDNSCYALNFEMIHNVVVYKDASLCGQLNQKNYTTIISLGYAPLIEYVQENLPLYIDNIVMNGTNQHDNIDQIIDLIQRSIDDVKRCENIIRFEVFRLDDISVCCGDSYTDHKAELEAIWKTLLECDKIEVTWENVERYWSYFGLSDTLIKYIVEHVDILETKESKGIDDALRKELVQSDIELSVFTRLLKHMRVMDFDVPLENIYQANVEVMIEHQYLTLTAERYRELSECYPSCCKGFILKNQTAFLTLMPTISLTAEVFESLITDGKIDSNLKEKLLSNYGAMLMSKVVAESICSHGFSVSKNVFDAAWSTLDTTLKKVLMFGNLDTLEAEDFQTCFEEIGEPYQEFVDRSRRHNVTLSDSEEHQRLVRRLKQVDYITSCEYISAKERDEHSQEGIERATILCRVKVDGNSKSSNSI